MAADDALNTAIAEVEEQLLNESSKTVDEKDDDSTEDTTSDETDTSSTTEELTADQIKEAQTLYKLLLDPKQRLNIVAALAQDSGLLQNRPLETPKQVAKAEKGIAELIDEALPEYPGLSKKLGPVIEKIVETEREARTQETEQVHLQQVEQEVVRELDNLAKDTKGTSRKVENKMASLMNEISPGPNVTVKQYIRMLHTLATAGDTVQKTSAQIADKIRRNANNAPDRLNGSGGRAPSSEMPSKKMNLNDSVNWAIDQAFKNAKNRN